MSGSRHITMKLPDDTMLTQNLAAISHLRNLFSEKISERNHTCSLQNGLVGRYIAINESHRIYTTWRPDGKRKALRANPSLKRSDNGRPPGAMPRFELSVGEPWNFVGPDGANRIVVDFAGFVAGPKKPNWQSRYALLTVVAPFEFLGETVSHLFAAPRYVGVSIEGIVRGGGTVGVARVRSASSVAAGGAFDVADVEYVITGELRALHGSAVNKPLEPTR